MFRTALLLNPHAQAACKLMMSYMAGASIVRSTRLRQMNHESTYPAARHEVEETRNSHFLNLIPFGKPHLSSHMPLWIHHGFQQLGFGMTREAFFLLMSTPASHVHESRFPTRVCSQVRHGSYSLPCRHARCSCSRLHCRAAATRHRRESLGTSAGDVACS
jgi:hypothetical protein